MSAQEAQYTITRKRKRQVAIDPCLGFYCNISSLSTSQSATAIATNANNGDSEATDLPGWTLLPQDPPSPPLRNQLGHDTNISGLSDFSSEPEPLTVETFLQRSALGRQRIYARKYGRKHRNRRIIQSDNEGAEDGCPNGQLNANRTQALSLLPIQKSNNDAVKAKPRAIRLWNTANAKGVPFRTSSFSESTKTKKETFVRGSTDAQCHPLSTWSTLRKPSRRNEPIQKISSIRKHSTRCAPLVFVPLADVEEAYNKKFHSARSFLLRILKEFPDVMFYSATRREARHGQEPQRPSVVPLTLVPADNTENVSPNQSCQSSSPIAPPAKLLLDDCIHEPAPEVPDSLPLTVTATRTQALPMCPKKTSSDKHLRPLGSFLEGFIERVRAATQAEDAIASHSDDQLSILDFVQSQESLDTSKPISERGLEETLSTQGRTPRSPCSDGATQPRCDQPLASTSSHAHTHVTTTGVSRCERTSLYVSDDPCSASQEFPPYVPPSVPFDINAALLAYTQAGNSSMFF